MDSVGGFARGAISRSGGLNIGIVLGCEIKRKDGRSAGEYDDTTGFDVQPKNFAVGLELRARRGKTVGKEWMSVWVEDHRRSFSSPSASAALLYVRDGLGGLS